MVERRARNPEVRGSNPGSGSNFSLENLIMKKLCQLTESLIKNFILNSHKREIN